MEQQKQSINILIANAKQQLADLINKSSMPPVLWTYILKDILLEVESLAAQQLQNDLRAQQEQQNEETKS